MSQGLIQPFNCEADYRAAIDLALSAANRHLCGFDQDLTGMGLESPLRIAALSTFLKNGGRLQLVVHDPAPLEQQRMPRFLGLLRLYRHLAEVRRTPDHLRRLADCWLLADQNSGVIRFHRDHPRGKLALEAADEIVPWWRRFDELWIAAEACSLGIVMGL